MLAVKIDSFDVEDFHKFWTSKTVVTMVKCLPNFWGTGDQIQNLLSRAKAGLIQLTLAFTNV